MRCWGFGGRGEDVKKAARRAGARVTSRCRKIQSSIKDSLEG